MINKAFFIVLTVGLFFGQTDGFADDNYEEIIKEVVALDKKRGEALKNKDYEFLNEVYADDWTYVIPSGTIMNKKDYFNLIKYIDYKKIEYEYLNSRCYNGNTVVINLINRIDTVFQGKEEKQELLYTRVYVKENGKWKIVAQQGTKISEK